MHIEVVELPASLSGVGLCNAWMCEESSACAWFLLSSERINICGFGSRGKFLVDDLIVTFLGCLQKGKHKRMGTFVGKHVDQMSDPHLRRYPVVFNSGCWWHAISCYRCHKYVPSCIVVMSNQVSVVYRVESWWDGAKDNEGLGKHLQPQRKCQFATTANWSATTSRVQVSDACLVCNSAVGWR